MPFAAEAFSTLGETSIREGRRIGPADVRDAAILAVRSTTRVDRALLAGSAVRFVGTATIGYDHFDVPYLESAGIRWCSAPGCNANSVSEYLVSALLFLARREGFTLRGKTIGVIGVGNVGSLVVEKAKALGMRVLLNDPPRKEATGDPAFLPLVAVLAESDIVTLHVPLTAQGPHPTLRMADDAFFAKLKRGAVFINAARGEVVDTDALLRAMDAGVVAHAVVDTWEGEPAFRADLLARVSVGTPHIAGHSFEGKAVGTVMVYEAACRFLGVAPAWSPEGHWPPPPVPEITVEAAGCEEEDLLWEAVRRVYDIEADDARLREGGFGGAAERARHFDRLRRDYPVRREFRFTEVTVRNGGQSLLERLAALGFRVRSSWSR